MFHKQYNTITWHKETLQCNLKCQMLTWKRISRNTIIGDFHFLLNYVNKDSIFKWLHNYLHNLTLSVKLVEHMLPLVYVRENPDILKLLQWHIGAYKKKMTFRCKTNPSSKTPSVPSLDFQIWFASFLLYNSVRRESHSTAEIIK